MLFIVARIWADTNLSIGISPTGHNPVVPSINFLYLAVPTRSSKVTDWMSDPTDDFGIISLAPSVGKLTIKLFLQQNVTLFNLE